MVIDYKTLTAGSILNSKIYNYVIEKVLGQGTFGITYLAKVQMLGSLGQLDSNVHVTIKEFFMKEINGREGTNVTSTSDSKGGLFYEYKQKFAREAKNLSKLKHPNIVNVMDYFEANKTCYYVMEYLSGGDLDKLIEKQKGLDETEALRYTNQIGSALTFMHNNKMLHLDLKPKNVMLDAEGNAKLIDFGLSKQYDRSGEPESSTTVGRGTPGYAPLEQANYQDGHGFPVTMDVYSLGATMYKMLTGVRAPEASVLLNDGFPKEELQNKNISREMISVIEKAMSPMKKNRYQTVEEIITELSYRNQQEHTITEFPLSITKDVESIEIYHDEGSIPYSHYYKFIISPYNQAIFEIGIWGDKKDCIKLDKTLYNELIDRFKEFHLSYTVKETGDEYFTGGENTKITIFLNNKNIIQAHLYGGKNLSFGNLQGDVDSLISFLLEIPEVKESIEFVQILEKAGDDGYNAFTKGHDAFKQGNQKLAFKLFGISAERGDSHGQAMLGYCYETGFGTNINHDKAFSWYKKSSEQDNPIAYFNLASAYKEGRGVSKDIEKAKELYKKAADLGDKDALERYNAIIEHNKHNNVNGSSITPEKVKQKTVYIVGLFLLASIIYEWRDKWSYHLAWGICNCLIVLFSTIIAANRQRAFKFPLLWCGVMVPFAAMQLFEFGPWHWDWQLHYWEKWLWEAPLIIVIYTIIIIYSKKIAKFHLFIAIASILCALLMTFGW